MKNNNIIQGATKGMTDTVDNLVLQTLIKMTEEVKIKDEEMLRFQLNKCEFCSKQRIFFDSEDKENRENIEICMFCQKPVNEVVLVYQYTKENGEVKQLYGLEKELEELMQKQ